MLHFRDCESEAVVKVKQSPVNWRGHEVKQSRLNVSLKWSNRRFASFL